MIDDGNELRAHDAIIVRRAEELQGYCFGFRQKCLLLSVELSLSGEYRDLETRLRQVEQTSGLIEGNAYLTPDENAPDDARILLLLAAMASALQHQSGIPLIDIPRIVRREQLPKEQGLWASCLLALPSQLPEAAGRSFAFFAGFANALLRAPEACAMDQAQHNTFDALAAQFKKAAGNDEALRLFMQAALSLGIPYQHLSNDTLQLGWGSRSWLQYATSSDRTSVVGVNLAKNKMATSALLATCGMPVPRNVSVSSEDRAVEAAAELGYPVVIKPVDRDHGAGATAGVQREEDVRKAYRKAFSSSPKVMVEKFVEGVEYRLLVVNGRLFWAVERIPARVSGDGISSVRQLIETINEARIVDPDLTGVPQKIVIDEDLEDVVQRQGLTLDSVPQAGELVRLRDTALVSTGGKIHAAFDKVHPDNAELAVRAARMLRLDIAGIDYLTTDISRSWRETGGCITEVNALPQFSATTRADIYPSFVRELRGRDGRIPVAVVVGSETSAIENELRARAAGRPETLGIASADRITIGAAEIPAPTPHPAFAARVLTLDETVDAIVLFSDGQAMSGNGLPFDRIDMLVLAARQAQGVNPAQLLSVVRDNIGEVVIQGGATEAANLGRMIAKPASHAGNENQLVRKLLSMLPGYRKS